MKNELLKNYFQSIIELSPKQLAAIDYYFSEHRIFDYKDYLPSDNGKLKYVGFITNGAVRQISIHKGLERTCCLSLEGDFIADSITALTISNVSETVFQAIEPTELITISHEALEELYGVDPVFERLGRLVLEKYTATIIQLNKMLAFESPEERYLSYLKLYPEVVMRIPQKYIASLLGISEQSLSRIKRRIFKSRLKETSIKE